MTGTTSHASPREAVASAALAPTLARLRAAIAD
jgi:hypothetical protein